MLQIFLFPVVFAQTRTTCCWWCKIRTQHRSSASRSFCHHVNKLVSYLIHSIPPVCMYIRTQWMYSVPKDMHVCTQWLPMWQQSSVTAYQCYIYICYVWNLKCLQVHKKNKISSIHIVITWLVQLDLWSSPPWSWRTWWSVGWMCTRCVSTHWLSAGYTGSCTLGILQSRGLDSKAMSCHHPPRGRCGEGGGL